MVVHEAHDFAYSGEGSIQLRMRNDLRHIETAWGWKPRYFIWIHHIDTDLDGYVPDMVVKLTKIENWSKANFTGEFVLKTGTIYLELESDAMLFKLMYGDEVQ